MAKDHMTIECLDDPVGPNDPRLARINKVISERIKVRQGAILTISGPSMFDVIGPHVEKVAKAAVDGRGEET